MDLHEEKYFIAIAKNRSLTAAAEQVHVSQQALSLYLSRLEKQLKAILFIRSPQGMELTELGSVYLECCRKNVENWEQAAEQIRRICAQAEEKDGSVL